MRWPKAAAALAAAGALLAPGEGRAAEARFALSMMHFNLQYVAGGLWGYLLSSPTSPMDDIEVEDRIITQSFEPVLDLYAKHPGWGANVEMQGYMLEVLHDRHPAVFGKLQALAQSGQIEVVSFHYSDQLYLAYPREDWERSAQRTRATFDRLGVPLGKAVFCQEGQAGPGLAAAMAAHGYGALVWPKNLFSYQHPGEKPAPLYRFGEGFMLTYEGQAYTEGDTTLSTVWTFVDDGELLASADQLNPYLGDAFVKSDKSVADHEAKVAALEQQGYTIATVSAYVEAIKGLVTPRDPPPLLDGTWQPGSTDGTFRWLGGKGAFGKEERDADARSVGALAHRELLAAEALAARAGLDAAAALDGAWRLLLLGQVSDATGVNPFRGEVEYALAHEAEALRLARSVIRAAKETLKASRVAVDTASGEVQIDPPDLPAGVDESPPVMPQIKAADRAPTVTSRALEAGHHVLSIAFPPGESRSLSVTFAGQAGDIVYTPALTDAPVHVPRSAFGFEHFDLALSDGLIGLGPSLFVIKDQARSHVAARVTPGSGDVMFHDDTSPAQESTTWVFHLIEGDEAAAAAVARSLNVTPRLFR